LLPSSSPRKEAREDHNLVAFGRRRWSILFISFHFPPNKFYLNIFSIGFKILLYHGSRPLLYVFPSFSLTYKLQSRILMYQFFHTLIAKLILIKDFFFFLNLWHRAWPHFTCLKWHKWMNNCPGSRP
jgi:hypothetical protein